MIKILQKDPTQEILAKCKKSNKVEKDELMFVDLSRDMFLDNEYILKKYFRNETLQDCYYANLLAYQPFKSIMSLKDLKKCLKNDFGKEVSLKGYKYNPDHFRFAEFCVQLEYEEDLFREQDDEESDALQCIEPIDFDAVDSLIKVLFKAIQQRYLIILNLDTLPGIINNALDCYFKGVSCAPSNKAMNNKIFEIRTLLENKAVQEWLLTGVNDLSLDDKYDYISTYQKALRQITDIRNESLENYCYDLIHNENDELETEILKNELPEMENLYNNSNNEDEDDD